MLAGEQVVCLASLPLGGRPSTWAHLARVLARTNEVLFVDPPTNLLRAPNIRGRFLPAADGIAVYEPPSHLPYSTPLRRRITGGLNRRRYSAAVGKAVRELGWSRPIIWHSMPTMFSAGVISAVEPGVEILHVTDDVWAYPDFGPVDEAELRQVAERADLVVATTPAIAARLSSYGVTAELLEQGVDVALFAPVAEHAVEVAGPLRSLRRPRLGFVGQLDWRLDIDTLVELASAEGSVVLVGPSALDADAMQRLRAAGCQLFPEVAYGDVPQWLAGIDVALVPYRPTDAVKGSRPLKLLDYLAAGLPVVSTDIPAARDLAPAVALATGPAEFRSATAQLWRESGSSEQRVDVARAHSWEQRAEEFSAMISAAREKRASH